MRIQFIFILLISFFLPGGFLQANAQETPEFDRLKAAFEEGQVFAASFLHEYFDGFTGDHQATEGAIWIGKDQYKIEGDSQRMVVDGEYSRVYDETRNRLIVSDYIEEEDDFAPSRMLQGVDDTYSVTEQPAANNETLIILTSDDPFSVFMEVSIYLGAEGNPLRIEATDQADNELITTFSSGRFIEADPGIFELNVPEEAEYIDLRNDTK